MGKFLNKLKKLFSTSDETETLHSSDVQISSLPAQPSAPLQNYVAESQPVSPVAISSEPQPISSIATTLDIPSLLTIAGQISQIPLFQLIGQQLVNLLSSPTPTKEAIVSIITQAQPIIDAQAPSLSTLNQTSQYQTLVKEMLNLAPLDAGLDHDHLAESNAVATLQSLTKYYNILEKLLGNSAFSAGVQTAFHDLTQPLTQLSTSFNNLITQFKTFKSQEATLRQEIEAYTQAVQQMQSQNSMSPDWGGKKSAFEQKGAELTKRRNAYLQDESRMNQSITTICSQITTFQDSFKEFLTLLLSELATPPEQTHLLQIKEQIDTFQAFVKQIASLIA